MTERAPVEKLDVAVYEIPTDYPEADGTLAWDSTTLVVVQAHGGGRTGLGYTYGHRAVASVISDTLDDIVVGGDAFAIGATWQALQAAVRNHGRAGVCSMAIAAVDVALWDLKARMLDVPLALLLGPVRDHVAIYGSGGFTSYPLDRLQKQLAGWVDSGIGYVKIKVGSEPATDVARVRAAREAIGVAAALFVDANGAYTRKQALERARAFAQSGVTWFEEPVSSDDVEGLRFLRERVPAGMDVTAGEYGYDAAYFRRLLEAGAVDVMQPDATRCGGITGFLQAAALCDAFAVPVSSHTAPALHLHPNCAVARFRPAEYFHDHVRIEQMLFDGVAPPEHGCLHPDLSRSGLGLEFKHQDAEPYRV
jgi:L-alanine-DL-glutamate epimerase-like enolase superfamily enzyme